MRNLFFVLCLTLGVLVQLHAEELHYLFKKGESGYACFRIPAIVTTVKGTVLAFSEARKRDCGDAGDIDLVLKRSIDGGKSWSPLVVVWEDGANTCGNPAPVVDQATGRVVLLSTWNLGVDREPQIIEGTSRDTRRIFVLYSEDDGQSWSTAREITPSVKRPDWTWYATGPGNGIQLRSRKFRGRLVIPCDHIEAGTKKYFSHSIHSDDGGETWVLGGTTPTDQVNECTVAELPGGNLVLNMRNYTNVRVRQTSISKNGGMSWSSLQAAPTLIEPVCQASLIWYSFPGMAPFLAFSNPASQTARVRMTVRLSFDTGKSWGKSFVLHEGPAAYSNLVALPNGNLGCLFEAGVESPYEGIVLQEISMDNLKRTQKKQVKS